MTNRIAFIDTYLIGYGSLINALQTIKVELINPLQDGWLQIVNTLAMLNHNAEMKFDSIVIFGHGAPGSIILGSSLLNVTTLSSYTAILAQMGNYLSKDAEILIHGSHTGDGIAGAALLSQMATIIGTNITACNDTDEVTAFNILGGSADFLSSEPVEEHRVTVSNLSNIRILNRIN